MSTVSKIQVDTKTFIRFWLVIIGFIIGILTNIAVFLTRKQKDKDLEKVYS